MFLSSRSRNLSKLSRFSRIWDDLRLLTDRAPIHAQIDLSLFGHPSEADFFFLGFLLAWPYEWDHNRAGNIKMTSFCSLGPRLSHPPQRQLVRILLYVFVKLSNFRARLSKTYFSVSRM